MKPALSKSRYRPSIDGLRAVAVLLVIGYHAFPLALPGGFVGVDMFFVISGFLISGILYGDFSEVNARGARIIKKFYGRRIRRIFPALSLVLISCYLIGFDRLMPQDFSNLCRDIAEAAGFCLNLALAGRTGYFAPDATTIPLLHIWSLGVEEQFYLFWPLIIWAAYRMRVSILPVAVFIGGCSFFWTIFHMSTPAEAAFFLPQTRLWELLIGATVAAIVSDKARAAPEVRIVRELCALAGTALIIAGVIMATRDSGTPNTLTLLPTIGTVLVICAGEETLVSRGILSRKIAVSIGLISYPLYLWHWPLLTFTRFTSENGNSPEYVFGAIAVSVALAWATYRFLEYPVRSGSRSALKVTIPFAAVVTIGFLGYFSFRHAGFPSRLPPILRDQATVVEGHEISWRVGDYFLKTADTGDNFKVDKNEILRGKPTLFLWGDSHAASLYPGYAKYFARGYNIVQRTVQGTAPILGLDFLPNQPNSRPINDYIFASIKRERPECVVLSANWLTYDWTQLKATIRALKSIGVGQIIVIGPLPQWKGLGLPQQLYNYYRTHLRDPLPMSMMYGARVEPLRVDSEMRRFCATEGVDYLSPCKLLSNKEGFITRVGDTPESIITFDYGHLTKTGSEYLVSKFPGASR